MNDKFTEFCLEFALLVIVAAVIIGVCLPNKAEAKSYKCGVSITVPLNFKDTMKTGTMTMYIEAYEADQYSYTQIDNSVYEDNDTNIEVNNRVTNKTTNNTSNSTQNTIIGAHNHIH